MLVGIKRTVQQIRDAIAYQRILGCYEATPRELPFGTWVWVEDYVEHTPTTILGAIIDINKHRETGRGGSKGQMVRNYTVLTTEGQAVTNREKMVVATPDEVRNTEGVNAEQDLKDAVFTALEQGPSEANTIRGLSAMMALRTLNQKCVIFSPVRGGCDLSCCRRVLRTSYEQVFPVLSKGHW